MRPFEGLRVLDLTHVFAGPFCAYQLSVLGAEVIKIEPVGQHDMTRAEGADTALNAQGMGLSFQAQGGGKRTLALDLKSEQGREVFDRLVATAEVLVQNYTSHAVEELGLEYDRLSALKPDLIYCAISGFGATGPKAAHAAYDVVIQAFTGIMAANGQADGDPVRVGPAMVDYGTGAQAAMAISAALFGRSRNGLGRRIDVSMADCALMLMNSHTATTLATGHAPRPHGNQDPTLAGYATYDTADGQVMIGAFTNTQMANLMRVIGQDARADAIQATPRAQIRARREEDAAVLAEALATRTAAEWEDRLNAAHVPAARVRGLAEALEEEQLATRPVIQTAGDMALAVAGFGFDHGGPSLDHAPRAHGADSRSVLAELGIGQSEFDALQDQGVVFSPSS
ncbi:CaiB/BaiF CoA transferase family protein [Falsiruegeria mediterranea]|uniref:Acetyl-CoA:oxalate CoA-transferase n=1 Tax=Falsiruegeria mediterranea M17 TaxID=1200281 RepID=A0A2R8CBY8_9RHOB|nr:CaiB/BaiF CoA-transferase family protein [Falsiruegeria mediterranea]SPJ29940.1 Acetyl-CoA:oxalate CoA-transferase [Falsiruegeria mediterranea M17]